MGEKLLNDLAESTGLPAELVDRELRLLIEKKGLDVQSINLEQIRNILVEYLQDVILSARENL